MIQTDKLNQLQALYQKVKPSLSDFLSNNLPINIFLVDEEGYVAWVNNRLLKTSVDPAFTLNDVIGKHISYWGKDRWALCQKVIENNVETIEEELALDGRFYLSSRNALTDESGNIIGLLGVSLDITERKQAELAKDEFVANMSHDLRTPLNGILGLSEYLIMTEKDQERKTLLEDLRYSGQALLNLFNQVIDLVSVGKQPVQITSFNLKDILNDPLDLIRSEAKNKNLRLNIDCPYINIQSDKMRITRILLNLLNNAVKFTTQGSITLKIIEDKERKTLNFSVSDTGIGIPEDKLPTIFNRFTKVTTSFSQPKLTSSGIGLHLAKQFADDLHGHIQVSSKLGQGTIFTFILPT